MALPETAHLLDLNLSCPHNSDIGGADEQIQEAIACGMALSISYDLGAEVPIPHFNGPSGRRGLYLYSGFLRIAWV